MSPQAGWILQAEVVPRLRASIPRNVHCVGSEDAEELIQDSIAIAAKMLHSAEAAGKQLTPGNLAHYALKHVKSGRRSTGSSVVDVMAPGTQLNGHAWLNSLDEPLADQTSGEGFTFNDVLASDQEDPATIAGRNLDWQSLLTRLSSPGKGGGDVSAGRQDGFGCGLGVAGEPVGDATMQGAAGAPDPGVHG
jgi:hypothetical protein